MKLLYITNQICGAAGLERVLSIKTSALAENYGYEVHIITLNQGSTPLFYNFSDKIKHHDITVKGNIFKYLLRYNNGISTIVKSIRPDVISVCDDGLKGFFLPLLLGKPCPMVYERHVSKEIERKRERVNLLASLKRMITYRLMYLGGSMYSTFVVLTNRNQEEWPLKNTIVINNPLSFDADSPKSSLEQKVVLAVGRQDFQKGYDRLLKIWSEVTNSYPDWRLMIFGKKNESLGLVDLAQELNISSSVYFKDPIKNIGLEYQSSSVFVLSSRYEGFGMVLTEAMIHGVPCVSFDCPYGPSDIIDHEINGFLVDNGDIDGFSGKLKTLMGSIELRKKMGQAAIKKAERFKPDIIVPKWDYLFKSLTKKS